VSGKTAFKIACKPFSTHQISIKPFYLNDLARSDPISGDETGDCEGRRSCEASDQERLEAAAERAGAGKVTLTNPKAASAAMVTRTEMVNPPGRSRQTGRAPGVSGPRLCKPLRSSVRSSLPGRIGLLQPEFVAQS